ncbi:hypothetical protein G3I77_10410 [Streptomyces sp. D2-8]|uniref:hypothetical protein n=1 Tax=Streptomyces sp. D2-8 TaxID=2707767 RepID=UPI0020C13044|nr:hypothetical protein [Streptomyces sp. D2-8]MCK8433437.1 hypothetical protein [Streptomyces sp. D2-8]
MTHGETEQENDRTRRPENAQAQRATARSLDGGRPERAPSRRVGHTEESGVTAVVAGREPRPDRGGEGS